MKSTIKITQQIISLLLILLFHNILVAQSFPSGFSQVKVASISEGSAMAFAPDGRLFVCQKTGAIRIVKNGTLLSTPFLTLSVDINGERGVSSICFDPNFNTNHYVYIYYTAKTPTIHNRLSRFTANGDVVQSGSEVPLLDAETVTAIYHNGGGMGFGLDGKLYLAMGEDNKPSNSQNMGTYKGKLLRLNPDGSAPADNPITKKIWCIGLRNPYTLSIQPGTGRIFVNNVGADNYEEIHDATNPGQNFGWPYVEGYSSDPNYDNPYFAYPHNSTGQNGCCIGGGTFFNPTATNYPSQFQGKYFYQDFCDRWIYYISTSGSLNNTVFATNLVTQNLAIQVGPDGNLYYINRYNTQAGVYKIIYTNNNAPVITNHPASQSITQGQPVTFSVTASGATPMSYQWKKNGTNISGATGATFTIASVQQSDAGQYSVLVSNSYGSALSNNATLTVTAFNAQPSAIINTPTDGMLYTAGQTVSFSGSATDPEDGTLPASAFNWYVEFDHNQDHQHPGPELTDGVTSGSFVIPNTGESSANVFYRLILIVTDSKGLKDTAFIRIYPKTSILNFSSEPTGLNFTFDSQPKTAPYSVAAVEGMNIPIGAVSPQYKNGQAYVFDHWSNSGTQNQTIVVGTNDASYTVYYNDTVLACSATGTIMREVWNNKSSSSLSESVFSTAANSTSTLTKFEGPSSAGDNYNSRIRGYICPPQSGNYTFWIASDNNSELWLSTDDNPANKIKIAYVSTYTGSKEWTKYSSQRSAPVQLVQGGKYYIEAIHHEGTGGDNLAVGWQLPDATFERPIPGSRLMPFDGSSTPPPSSENQLIAAGDSWKYLDNGTDQGTAWRSYSFNDAGWKTGNAQLGYGDGDETTVVSYGSSSNKYITTYFRKKFNVTSLSNISGLELQLLRDDGAIVYINGNEVWRTNMTSSSVTYTTRATTYIDGPNESVFNIKTLSPSVLTEGDNIIAVEIHQNSSSSSDISFDLKLNATGTSGGGGGTGTVSVNITSPTNNFTFSSPTNISITANASTTSGSITKVEFYSGGIKIGEDLTSPWSYTWENVTTGNYAITAKAFNSGGQSATSSIVNVIVNTCATPTITASGPLRMCSGSVTLNSNTGSGFSYQWIKDGTNISGATAPSYTATASGSYQVRIIVGTCAAWSAPTKVKIESGLAATITAGGPTTFCNGGNVVLYGNTCSGYSYQWKRNGSDIPGATSSTYTATVGGEYQLKVTQNGVNAWSSKLMVTVNNCTQQITGIDTEIQSSASEQFEEGIDMKVFPNPNTGLFTFNIKMPGVNSEKVIIRIVNLLGEQVYSQELAAAEEITQTIQLDGNLQSGVYSLQVVHGDKVESLNVVLAR